MRYLCIDTSNGASVSIVDCNGTDFITIAHKFTLKSNMHGEKLAVLLKEVLQVCEADNICEAKIDAVVCGIGPAPFTGLRAGLITARVLAFSANLPLYGVCSLDALALQGFDYCKQMGENPNQILVVNDAKRKEVYYGLYELNGENDVKVLDEVGVDYPENVCQKYKTYFDQNNVVNVGQGVEKYSQYFDSRQDTPTEVQSATLARIAYSREKNGIALDNIEPLYLRRPDVQEPKVK